MKAFFFLVFLPMISGVVTQYYGVGWFSGNVIVAALINVPVCMLSVAIYKSFDENN